MNVKRLFPQVEGRMAPHDRLLVLLDRKTPTKRARMAEPTSLSPCLEQVPHTSNEQNLGRSISARQNNSVSAFPVPDEILKERTLNESVARMFNPSY